MILLADVDIGSNSTKKKIVDYIKQHTNFCQGNKSWNHHIFYDLSMNHQVFEVGTRKLSYPYKFTIANDNNDIKIVCWSNCIIDYKDLPDNIVFALVDLVNLKYKEALQKCKTEAINSDFVINT